MIKKVKIILLVVVIVVVLIGGYGAFYYKRYLDYKQAVQTIRVAEPDLTQLKDGDYVGEHDIDFIRAKVKVEVANHQFQTINLLEHYNDRGKKADILPEKMVDQQKIKVDAISGATNSSKVIQKAVEKALMNE